MIVLIDTNILLDVLQKRDPYFEDARRVWNLTEQGILHGYISAISFNNIYYVMRKQSGKPIAKRAVSLLRGIFHAVALDERIVDEAIALASSDFEDAIQVASALQIHADFIISRDQKDFSSAAVPAVTATEFLAMFRA